MPIANERWNRIWCGPRHALFLTDMTRLFDSKATCMATWVPRVGAEAARWRWKAQVRAVATLTLWLVTGITGCLVGFGAVTQSALSVTVVCLSLAGGLVFYLAGERAVRRARHLAMAALGIADPHPERVALPPRDETRYQAWRESMGLPERLSDGPTP